MAALTRYGSFWSQIPVTAGNVYWVAAAASYTVAGQTYSASDGNDGLDPRRALLTLDYAVGKCTANAGDVIVLLPGAHSWSSSVAADVAGITITGLPGGKGQPYYSRTSITTSASDEVINVTAANIELAHLRIIPVTQNVGVDFTAAADQLYVHDCVFDLYTPAAHTSTKGIACTTASIAADNLWIEGNVFVSDGAQGYGLQLGNPAGAVVKGNKFIATTGTWATAVLLNFGTGGYALFEDNEFATQADALMTNGIEGTTGTNTGAIGAIRNWFSFAVSKPFESFDTAGTLWIAENYKANTGAGSGGALVTAIT